MKKICVLAACLVLVASLALPAFAADTPITVVPMTQPGPVVNGSQYTVGATVSFVDLAPSFKVSFYTGRQNNADVTSCVLITDLLTGCSISFPGSGSENSYRRVINVYNASGVDVTPSDLNSGRNDPKVLTVTDQMSSLYISYYSYSPTGDIRIHKTVTFTITYPLSVSPAFGQPTANGSYVVTALTGTSASVNMYATKEQPKTFVFSDVTANTGTKVSYAITAEGGSVTYHDIGTLEDGFTFASADYPVASYFTIRNTGSTPASYTVTVSDAAIDKSSGIALSIWETCLTMGTAAITWITTGTNFIALIPIAMMLLVFAVLCIRKLIKGV